MSPFVTCDQNKEPVEVSVCLRNHQDACQDYYMRQRSKALEKYNPCRCCPVAIELKEKKDMPKDTAVKTVNSPYIKGKCPDCGVEKSILKKKGICQACLQVGKDIAAVTAGEPVAAAPVLKSTAISSITLDFTKYPWLKESLEKCADNEMRTVHAQAMWILQYHLTEAKS